MCLRVNLRHDLCTQHTTKRLVTIYPGWRLTEAELSRNLGMAGGMRFLIVKRLLLNIALRF